MIGSEIRTVGQLGMRAKSVQYCGCDLTETSTTTDVTRQAFGRPYQTVARIWGVCGPVTKPAGRRPLLTSLTEARRYVRAVLDARERRGTTEEEAEAEREITDLEHADSLANYTAGVSR